MVQWLGLCALTAEGMDSIPGRELRSHKLQSVTEKKKKRNCFKRRGEGEL